MKIVTTFSFLFLGLLAFAQNTSLTIFNNGGQQFFVIMNGIRQNSIPQTNVKIGGMSTGSYEIKLIFADGKTGDINKKIWLEMDGAYLTRVDIKGKKGKLKWFGMPSDGTLAPGGGTNIQYRPNDQSVYSDQNVVSNGSATGQGSSGTQTGQVQTGQGSYGTQQTQTTGQGSYQTQGGQSMNQQGGQGAYQTGTVTSGTTINDPGMNGGQVTMNTNVGITDPTMTGNGSMQTTTTTTSGSQGSHPGTPMGTVTSGTTVNDPMNGGQFGMNTNIVIVDPIANGGVGGVQMTTTANDGSGQPQTISTGTTIVDPIENGGVGGVNMNVFGSGMGMPDGMTGTTSSSSSSTVTSESSSTVTQNGQVVEDNYNYNQTATNTVNGQTTTQTTQYGYQNGQPTGTNGTTTTYGHAPNTPTYGNGGSYGTQGSMNTNTQGSSNGYYNCTSVMTDIDGFVARINAQDFDADKRELIETDLKAKCVSADQAYRIINTLDFEADRLDLSKYLYDRMTDKMNGNRLLELLDFDMNKEELKEYMKTH